MTPSDSEHPADVIGRLLVRVYEIHAGMEQRHDLQSLGIHAFRLGPLVLIAELTGKTEIVSGT